MTVQRSASAPYSAITSSGSMPLPSDLDILRCCVSRTVPCRYTVWNGASPGERVPGEDHARDPEEQDLRRRDEHVGRVERAHVLATLVSGQPSVEIGQSHDENHVSNTSSSWRRPRRATSSGVGSSRRAWMLPLRVVPDGHAMPPPELARDVPVADALEPVDVHGFPSLGQDAHASRRARPRVPARRAASCARTTGRRVAAPPPCCSGSSDAPRDGGPRASRARPTRRASSRCACARRSGRGRAGSTGRVPRRPPPRPSAPRHR